MSSCALSRLTDLIEQDDNGNQVVVKRYGVWGTRLEIEKRGRKYTIRFPSGKEENFKTLEDAEKFLLDTSDRLFR